MRPSERSVKGKGGEGESAIHLLWRSLVLLAAFTFRLKKSSVCQGPDAPPCLSLLSKVKTDMVARTHFHKLTRYIRNLIFGVVSSQYLQRSAKRYANLAKQDPGRGRQNM